MVPVFSGSYFCFCGLPRPCPTLQPPWRRKTGEACLPDPVVPSALHARASAVRRLPHLRRPLAAARARARAGRVPCAARSAAPRAAGSSPPSAPAANGSRTSTWPAPPVARPRLLRGGAQLRRRPHARTHAGTRQPTTTAPSRARCRAAPPAGARDEPSSTGGGVAGHRREGDDSTAPRADTQFGAMFQSLKKSRARTHGLVLGASLRLASTPRDPFLSARSWIWSLEGGCWRVGQRPRQAVAVRTHAPRRRAGAALARLPPPLPR